MISRRGFLKTSMALIGGAVIATYVEPLITLVNTPRDWIEDRNDFYIVRIPDGKTFAKETLTKPTLFVFGLGSVVDRVQVSGFVNLCGGAGTRVTNSFFDCSKCFIEGRKSVVHVASMQGLLIADCQINAGGLWLPPQKDTL